VGSECAAAIRARYKNLHASQGCNANHNRKLQKPTREVQAEYSGHAHHASVTKHPRNEKTQNYKNNSKETRFYPGE
jgi:hypothetical protein